MSFSIFPRTVYKTKSKISGQIEVKEQLGKYTLHVDGLIQSGGMIGGIWKKPLDRIKNSELRIKDVLVLGLGGGTVVQLIKARYPEAKIIGIEIDPEIIKIGKKFFGLGEIKNLEIIKTDAIKWASNYQGDKFDLILVDLYIGEKFPPEVASDEFLKNLKKLLSKEGRIIFNWLKIKETKQFTRKLEMIFSQGESLDLRTNLFLIHRL